MPGNQDLMPDSGGKCRALWLCDKRYGCFVTPLKTLSLSEESMQNFRTFIQVLV